MTKACPVYSEMEASVQIFYAVFPKQDRGMNRFLPKKEMFSGGSKSNCFAKYFRETYCKWLIFISFVKIELASKDQLILFY